MESDGSISDPAGPAAGRRLGGSTVRPYVPSGYAACLMLENWEDPFQEIDPHAGREAGHASGRRGRCPSRPRIVPSDSYGGSSDCLGMTTAEARLLDATLRDAGLEQDEWRNRYLLEYHVDFDGAAPE